MSTLPSRILAIQLKSKRKAMSFNFLVRKQQQKRKYFSTMFREYSKPGKFQLLLEHLEQAKHLCSTYWHVESKWIREVYWPIKCSTIVIILVTSQTMSCKLTFSCQPSLSDKPSCSQQI